MARHEYDQERGVWRLSGSKRYPDTTILASVRTTAACESMQETPGKDVHLPAPQLRLTQWHIPMWISGPLSSRTSFVDFTSGELLKERYIRGIIIRQRAVPSTALVGPRYLATCSRVEATACASIGIEALGDNQLCHQPSEDNRSEVMQGLLYSHAMDFALDTGDDIDEPRGPRTGHVSVSLQ